MNETDIEKAQVELNMTDVKKYIAPNATDKELYMLMNIARSYGLNPFKREIHFVKYGQNPASIIVGYETYLKRAERTGKLDGWKCWIEKDNIGEKAIIEIKRKDQSTAIRWEVYRSEFDKQQSTWKAMPTFMLKKVAIAQGFRLAFPDDLGGMPYIPEEIPSKTTSEELPTTEVMTSEENIQDEQSQEPDTEPPQSHDTETVLATPQQIRMIHTRLNVKGIKSAEPYLERFGFTPSNTPKHMVNDVLTWIDNYGKAA